MHGMQVLLRSCHMLRGLLFMHTHRHCCSIGWPAISFLKVLRLNETLLAMNHCFRQSVKPWQTTWTCKNHAPALRGTDPARRDACFPRIYYKNWRMLAFRGEREREERWLFFESAYCLSIVSFTCCGRIILGLGEASFSTTILTSTSGNYKSASSAAGLWDQKSPALDSHRLVASSLNHPLHQQICACRDSQYPRIPKSIKQTKKIKKVCPKRSCKTSLVSWQMDFLLCLQPSRPSHQAAALAVRKCLALLRSELQQNGSTFLQKTSAWLGQSAPNSHLFLQL